MSERVVRVDDMTGKEALVSKKYRLTFTPLDEKDKLEEVSVEYDLTPESSLAIWRWLSDSDTRDMATIMRKLPVRVTGSDSSPASGTEEIRQWAKEQGLPVKDRGALSADVLAAYTKAHSEPTK